MISYIKNPISYGNKKMPPFADIIKSEEDMKLLVEYVRYLGENSLKKKK